MFWGAEGAGAYWPGGDAALLAIVPGVLVAALGISALASAGLRRGWQAPRPTAGELTGRP